MIFKWNKRGKLFKAYKKLEPKKITRQLDVKRWDPDQVVSIIYKLALYGGLHLQNTLWKRKIIRSADQDAIFIEGVAYTWANLHSSIMPDHDLPLHNGDLISQRLHVGSGVLAELLNRHTKDPVNRYFSSFYEGESRQEATETLNSRLFKISSANSSDPFKDQVEIITAVGIIDLGTQKGILESVKTMLEMYSNQANAENKVTSKILFELCKNSALEINLYLDSAVPKTGMPNKTTKNTLDTAYLFWQRECLGLCFSLLCISFLKKDKNFLTSNLNSEFGSSILVNLIRIAEEENNLRPDMALSKSKITEVETKRLKNGVMIALLQDKGEKINNKPALDLLISNFCQNVSLDGANNINAIQNLSMKIMYQYEKKLQEYT